jgi:hypothetical protein
LAQKARRHWHYRVAFAAATTLLLLTAVMLPLTVASVVQEVLGPPQRERFVVSSLPHTASAPTHTDLHLAVIALNETQQTATLRVTGYHVCETACSWSDRVRLFSLIDRPEDDVYPPSANITLPPGLDAVTQTVQLPLEGLPLRYPFDDYQLRLGLSLERVHADGTVEAIAPTEAPQHLFVTIQAQLAQHFMNRPTPLDPQQVQAASSPIPYGYVTLLDFHRLLYVRVLAVMLVLLIAAAAAYAVFLRPFQDLVINAGALIIGIWGIRSVLTPTSLQYVTAVDLSLSTVILFLLGAITVRAVAFLYARSELRRPRTGQE